MFGSPILRDVVYRDRNPDAMDIDVRNVQHFEGTGPNHSFAMDVWQPAASSRLHGIIERIWYWDGTAADPFEAVYPDVTIELVVQLDYRYRPVRAGVPGAAFPWVSLDGVRHEVQTIGAPSQRCRVLGVRMPPGIAFALLREPLEHLADRTVDVGDLLGRTTDDLVARCSDANDGPAAIANAADWVEHRLARDAIDDIAVRCARMLVARGGAIAIAALADEVGLSAASLTRRFKLYVGTTPKRFARIARFRKTLDALDAGATLADVTYRMRYSDHAHLDAEFRAHAGISPSTYRDTDHFRTTAATDVAAE